MTDGATAMDAGGLVKPEVNDALESYTAPAVDDASCVGRFIYLRWKYYGWSLGMVKELITAATPRLFKHYKVRVIWAVDEGMLDRRPSHGQCNLDLKACGPSMARGSAAGLIALLRPGGTVLV